MDSLASLPSLILSSIVSSFLYTFMLVNFQQIDFKENIKKIVFMFVTFAFLTGSAALYLGALVKVIALYLAISIINYLLLNKNKKESAIYSLVTYAIIILCEILSVIMLIVFLKIDINLEIISEYYLILHLLIVALAFIMLNIANLIFKKIHFHNYVRETDKSNIILYFGINLLFLAGFWLYIGWNLDSLDNQIYNLAMVIILLSTNVALILFQSNLSVKEKLIKSISKEKEKSDMYIEVMEELLDNIKAFKHDYANSLMTLDGYVGSANYDQASKFIKNLSAFDKEEKILQYYELRYLKDTGLKSLIIGKVSDMIKKDLDFAISIDKTNTLEDHKINKLDLSRILGVILDNAIEASEVSCEKKIFISILQNISSTEIVVSNSFLDSIDMSKLSIRGYSTKGHGRGIGLYNLNNIVDKYNSVNVFTSINENLFIQRIELLY